MKKNLVTTEGKINVSALRSLIEKELSVITVYNPDETVSVVRYAVATGVQLTRKISLLSEARPGELAAYAKRNGQPAEGQQVYLHMATLYFHETYSDGFALDMFEMRLIESIVKKISKLQTKLSGFGLPPFSYSHWPAGDRLIGLDDPS